MAPAHSVTFALISTLCRAQINYSMSKNFHTSPFNGDVWKVENLFGSSFQTIIEDLLVKGKSHFYSIVHFHWKTNRSFLARGQVSIKNRITKSENRKLLSTVRGFGDVSLTVRRAESQRFGDFLALTRRVFPSCAVQFCAVSNRAAYVRSVPFRVGRVGVSAPFRPVPFRSVR